MSTLNPTAPTQPIADHDRLPQPGLSPAPARTLRDVRVPFVGWIVAALCVGTFAWLLLASQRFDYYGDEWDFIVSAPDWTFLDYFQPHNEHWSTIPMISYSLLFSWFGTTGYVPFIAPLLMAHIGAAVLLFAIVRRRAGDLVGLGSAALVLIVAAGVENLVWAFQVGFVGSVTFGLLAIFLLDRVPPGPAASGRVRWGELRPFLDRDGRIPAIGAAAALVAALACSGVGLFMLATVATLLLLDRRWWRMLWIVAPAVLSYAVWYLTVGSTKLEVHRSPFSLEAFRELTGYVPTGLGAGFAASVSLTSYWGPQALAAGTAALALALYRNRLSRALPIAATVGVVLQFALTGLVRAQFGDGQATASRYMYIVAFFAVLMLCEAAGDLPWRGLWRPAVVAALVLITVHNAVALQRNINEHAAEMDTLEASLQTAWLLRDSTDWTPLLAPDPVLAPTLSAASYVTARARLGSPYAEPTVDSLGVLDPAGVNRTVRILLPLDITTAIAGTGGTGTTRCETVGEPGSTEPRIKVMSVNDGSVVMVDPHESTTLSLGQWTVGAEMDDPLGPVAVRDGEVASIRIRSSGVGLARHLTVQIPPGVAATVCVRNTA